MELFDSGESERSLFLEPLRTSRWLLLPLPFNVAASTASLPVPSDSAEKSGP